MAFPYDEMRLAPPAWFEGLRDDALEHWAIMVHVALVVRFTQGRRRHRKRVRRAAELIEMCIRSIGGLGAWEAELVVRELEVIASTPLPVAIEQLGAEYLAATENDA
jgi:hypothetical protein